MASPVEGATSSLSANAMKAAIAARVASPDSLFASASSCSRLLASPGFGVGIAPIRALMRGSIRGSSFSFVLMVFSRPAPARGDATVV